MSKYTTSADDCQEPQEPEWLKKHRAKKHKANALALFVQAVAKMGLLKKMNPMATHVLFALASYANTSNGLKLWPSMQTIAEIAGVSRTSVRKSMRQLEALGLLNTYKITNNGTPFKHTYRNLVIPIQEEQ